MRETTLAELDHAGLAAAYTTVYQDYFVPFVVAAGWAAHHLAAYGIAPADSPLWLDDDGQVIGLAALGRRGARGWVGGFGVAPEYRGRGLAARLIAALLDSARSAGLAEVQLEVITANARAIRTYERAGFVRTRDLRIFERLADAQATPAATEEVHQADPADLLPHDARLRAVSPPWQRESSGFAASAGLSGLALGDPATPDAYAIYRATPQVVAILDLVAPTADTAMALAAALPAQLPGRILRLSNEPEESPVCAALDRLGWRETLRQHEMTIAL